MATEILMPALSPTMEEGTLTKWFVKKGDRVTCGDILAEIETDKATIEFEAVNEGVIGELLVNEQTENILVNSPIAVLLDIEERLYEQDESALWRGKQAPSMSRQDVGSQKIISKSRYALSKSKGERIFASPLVRRMAFAEELDLSLVKGSGPNGRIVKADLVSLGNVMQSPSATENYRYSDKAASSHKKINSESIKKLYAGRVFNEVSLNGMRKMVAVRLGEAKQSIPHFYLRRDINIDALLVLRAEFNKELQNKSIKLSINDFIIKACAMALQSVNDANVVWAGDRLLRFEASDIAVAVAIDGGLTTPVIRDAEKKSLPSLSAEMKNLASQARDKKLMPHEYQGGSFTISNLGMYGIENFDAIINPPHSGILAVGVGKKKPVVGIDGRLNTATLMSVTLSVDHRAVDGALGAILLSKIVEKLENPLSLLI